MNSTEKSWNHLIWNHYEYNSLLGTLGLSCEIVSNCTLTKLKFFKNVDGSYDTDNSRKINTTKISLRITPKKHIEMLSKCASTTSEYTSDLHWVERANNLAERLKWGVSAWEHSSKFKVFFFLLRQSAKSQHGKLRKHNQINESKKKVQLKNGTNFLCIILWSVYISLSFFCFFVPNTQHD